MGDLFDRYRVIDVDSHVSEPADLWTSRVASRWREAVPQIRKDPRSGKEVWWVGGEPVLAVGMTAIAGYDGTLPECPDTMDDCPPAAHRPGDRLAYLDAEGIHAQVLYPNVGGFGSGAFLKLREPKLMLACVRAYNDFIVEWASADASRLIPIMATPFWDVDASVHEIERCAGLGHRGVLFGGQPQEFGQPELASRHWDPVFGAAQEAGLPISFHIGSGASWDIAGASVVGYRAQIARIAANAFIENERCLADIIFGGVCHRFPKLGFVSVESGVGWLTFALEAFDWQWKNGGVFREHPEYELIPSEYFRRQIHGCFWFEESGLAKALELYPDNILYETDYPHPTSMSVGPQSTAQHPRDYASRVLSGVPERTVERVLHGSAARLYGLATEAVDRSAGAPARETGAGGEQ
jgi:predicted TIM-barrel fold metal-dependent hydrolase